VGRADSAERSQRAEHLRSRSATWEESHHFAVAVRLRGQLGDQTRLPDAPRSAQHDDAAGTMARGEPALAQACQLSPTADEPRHRARVQRGRQVRVGSLVVELRILGQHGRMQALQLPARLDPELIDEDAPRLAVGIERVGLASTAIEGEHQRGRETLAARVLGDQLPELAHHRRVLPGGQIRLDARLERLEPLFLEPRDLRHERLAVELPER
jgi:hypothetical protein